MVSERFGKPWTAYHQEINAPTWSQSLSIKYVPPNNSNAWFYYSRGTPCTTPDDYSSNYAQVAYVTDATVPASVPGVDGIETLEKDHCLWAGQPQLYWAMGGGHNGHPTVTLRPDIVRKLDPYGMPEKPVEVTRAYGASEWAGCSYMIFQRRAGSMRRRREYRPGLLLLQTVSHQFCSHCRQRNQQWRILAGYRLEHRHISGPASCDRNRELQTSRSVLGI